MILRTRNSDLQREAGRAILASRGPLWLVVGGSERACKVRSGLFEGAPTCSWLTRETNPKAGHRPALRQCHAFTLMELLLVLALLAVAVAVAAPSL